MDTFKAIKYGAKHAQSATVVTLADIDWLIAEVERLRWIEDAAGWYVQYGGNGHIDNLHRVVKANPRPESGT